MAMNYREKERAIDRARDGFLRAAAALTDARTREARAFATIEGALAMHRLACADEGLEALALVEAFVDAQLESP